MTNTTPIAATPYFYITSKLCHAIIIIIPAYLLLCLTRCLLHLGAQVYFHSHLLLCFSVGLWFPRWHNRSELHPLPLATLSTVCIQRCCINVWCNCSCGFLNFDHKIAYACYDNNPMIIILDYRLRNGYVVYTLSVYYIVVVSNSSF